MGEDSIFRRFPNLPKMVVAFIKKLVGIIAGKDSELADKDAELADKDAELADKDAELADKDAALAEREKKLAELELENKKLQEANRELTERLNLNSKNSSIPPRGDGYRKNAAAHTEEADGASDTTTKAGAASGEVVSKNRSLRKKSGRQPGGQHGHKGHGMKFYDSGTPDEVVEHVPDGCGNCPMKPDCDNSRTCIATQNERVLEVLYKRVQHQTYAYDCPLKNGQKLVGEKPFEGTNRYGDSVAAFVTLLFTLGVVSYDRIRKIFMSLTGHSISTGTLHSFIQTGKDKVAEAVEYIKQRLISSVLVHFDETGMRVNSALKWMHTAANKWFTYLSIQTKRGEEGMRAAGVLGHFKGKAVTDCWSPYFKFKDIINILCNSHLGRELANRWQNTNQTWSRDLMELLFQMNDEKHLLMDQNIQAFPPERLERFSKRYDELVEDGIKLNPLPERQPNQRGRLKRGKTRALLDRLVERKDNYLQFAYDFSVPFTNNEAEQSVRCGRIRENVSGCFRTDDGAKAWAETMSYIKTAVKNGVSEYDAIKAMLAGDALRLIKDATVGKC